MIFSSLTIAALSATVVLAQDEYEYDSYYDSDYSLDSYADSAYGLQPDDGGFNIDARAGFKKNKKKKRKPRTTTPAPTTTEEPTTTTFPTTTTAQRKTYFFNSVKTTTTTTTTTTATTTTTTSSTTTTTTTTVAPAGKGKNNFAVNNKKPAASKNTWPSANSQTYSNNYNNQNSAYNSGTAYNTNTAYSGGNTYNTNTGYNGNNAAYGKDNYPAPAAKLSCWTCHAYSMADCNAQGSLVACQSNQESCELEIRERQGKTEQIRMGCKQKMACENNKMQNFWGNNPAWQGSLELKLPNPAAWTQCRPEPGYTHSVCRQCCETDSCTKDWYPTDRPGWGYTAPSGY
ncbi:Oidioi.mRNA.OKI2018_I69.chr1.g2799.t1.cds [Oikopleura dioica]|uniref:Oidioi.mRNA.OKI2018_I69.chr1.g2799.t1.cds n=1 Tax=Oikopleura dioica TaxID=34765 RepID=A0ABN7SS42_OIKDI|nr:Oidioi.mRNA.OKI2018_I69.chr1.g2799.t1.cds [Oikopleura dioica]